MSDYASTSDGTTEKTEIDRQLIILTQEGLPLTPSPFLTLAEELGISEAEVMARFKSMLASGAIRRIAAVPNHYKLGFTANGMSVWDVDDAVAHTMGREIGQLECVSHCYLRPRHLPDWPYNLFAMVHSRTREEVITLAESIRSLLGENYRRHEVLFSTRILKKTGLRIAQPPTTQD
ncbi:MAG: hypothetical protein WD356_04760 [Pseudomonadales bacterium]